MAMSDQIKRLIPDQSAQSVVPSCCAAIDGAQAAASDRPLPTPVNLEQSEFAPQATHLDAMRTMTRGIAHVLRNPLSIISGAAQIALAHPDEPEVLATSLSQVHAATMRVALIMDNLFSFARPRLEVAEDIDLNQVLRSVLEQFDEQLRRQRIAPAVALWPTLAPVAGDVALLRQMCGNLIQNACQAMDKGGTLTIATSMATERMVELSIADQGCGISADILPQIFDPFFTTRLAGKSLGLGLTVCQSIVQEHMGSITVCSLPEGGSTFIVRLPTAPSYRSTS